LGELSQWLCDDDSTINIISVIIIIIIIIDAAAVWQVQESKTVSASDMSS